MKDVKSRQSTTDEMFEPLKQTIELLKTYDQEMPEGIHKQLEVENAFLSAIKAMVRQFLHSFPL